MQDFGGPKMGGGGGRGGGLGGCYTVGVYSAFHDTSRLPTILVQVITSKLILSMQVLVDHSAGLELWNKHKNGLVPPGRGLGYQLSMPGFFYIFFI